MKYLWLWILFLIPAMLTSLSAEEQPKEFTIYHILETNDLVVILSKAEQHFSYLVLKNSLATNYLEIEMLVNDTKRDIKTGMYLLSCKYSFQGSTNSNYIGESNELYIVTNDKLNPLNKISKSGRKE
jgi:hypothetical protein